MIDNEFILSAKVKELDLQVAELKGRLTEVNQHVAHGNRLTIWQFISFTLVMAGTLFGTLAWVSTSLREENRQTREELRRQIEQTERNMNARFEDLRVSREDERGIESQFGQFKWQSA